MRPISFARYAGGLVERGVGGASRLTDLGDENARLGRGRGVSTTKEFAELELDDEMTDAFLLRSERVGAGGGPGEGSVTSMCSIPTTMAADAEW